MRFMILVKATKDTEAGVMPEDDKLTTAMAKYHEEVDGKEAEIEVRQLYELDDFAPSEAVERFRKMDVVSLNPDP